MKRARYLLMMLVCCVAIGMQAQQREHVVQRGEDFATIAKKYAITEQELMDANPSSKACYVGRKLIIPKHGVPVERKAVEAEPLNIELLSSDNAVLTKNAATTYQVGHSLWKKGKYDEAVKYLLSAVEQGDPRAYYPLGECYAQKDAKCHDEGKAVECLKNAVAGVKNKYDESYWKSCGVLAKRFFTGAGIGKDLKKAKQYTNEYQLYTDPDGRKEASALMRCILDEEHAIAEKELAERRALAAQKLAARQEQMRKEALQANAQMRGMAAQKGASPKNNAQSPQKEIVAGYTRVAGGLPQNGEKKYWNKSGSYTYCYIRHRIADGLEVYDVYPDPVDIQNLLSTYKYGGQRDGWIVLQRVNLDISMRMPSFNPMFRLPDINDYLHKNWREVPGEVLVSLDGMVVKLRDGSTYDVPIDEATANRLNEEARSIYARAVGAGLIKIDNGSSEVEKQLKAEIDEIDRRQAERKQKELDIYTIRDELNRGHRIIRDNTPPGSKPSTAWCEICNRFAPITHSHPINDGRH